MRSFTHLPMRCQRPPLITTCRATQGLQDEGEQCSAAIAGRIGTGMMVMGYLSAIVRDKEGAAECKAGAAGGGYHSACLTAYGALTCRLTLQPCRQ